MAKIIRTPTMVAGGITNAERELLRAHTAKWIANAMSTEPVNPDRLIAAIKSLYQAANLKEPRVVVVPSPLVMALSGGFAAAIWHVRKSGGAIHDAATDAATYAATYAATRTATVDATDAATYAATRVATYAATDAATYAATHAATYAATHAATHAATYAATAVATEVATDAATRVATEVATDDATVAATRTATDATAEVTSSQVNNAAQFLSKCTVRWWNMYQGGNMWSYYDCYLTAMRDVLGLRLPAHEKYAAWEQCAIEGGFRIMHDEFCIVSDRPEILRIDERNRPHCADGPSHRWRDGWSLYHWHGIRIPPELTYIITDPQRITVAAIKGQTNAELRRIMVERYGYQRYAADAGLDVIDSCDDNHPLVGLRTARLLSDGDITVIDLLNSTSEPDGSVKRYTISVDPEAYGGRAGRECLAAIASTWRKRSDPTALYFKRPEDYAPMIET